jgi:hypothetical protein
VLGITGLNSINLPTLVNPAKGGENANSQFRMNGDYKKGYMFTVANSDKRRCTRWKEKAIIGLRSVVKLRR